MTIFLELLSEVHSSPAMASMIRDRVAEEIAYERIELGCARDTLVEIRELIEARRPTTKTGALALVDVIEALVTEYE